MTKQPSLSVSCPLSQWRHSAISSCPLLVLSSVFPRIRFSSNESVLHIGWPKYWRFSFSTSPSNEYSELISFKIDWLHLNAVQGTLKSLLQHHCSNLDSVLKKERHHFANRVHIVKAMVFSVVMHECESWMIKKTEHWSIDAFEIWCWRRLLRVP